MTGYFPGAPDRDQAAGGGEESAQTGTGSVFPLGGLNSRERSGKKQERQGNVCLSSGHWTDTFRAVKRDNAI